VLACLVPSRRLDTLSLFPHGSEEEEGAGCGETTAMMVAKHRRGRTLIVRASPQPTHPAKRRRLSLASGLAAVVVLSSFAVFPLVTHGINPYDEGMIAYGAEQVLRGRQPSVHFYCPYGPGVFYLLAAAYQLLGTRLLVERWLSGALLVSIGVLSYLLLASREWGSVRRETLGVRSARAIGGLPLLPSAGGRLRVGISAVGALMVVLLLVAGWWYTPVNSGTLALMLLSGLLLQRGLSTGRLGWAGAAGVAAGLTLLWRFVFGGAVLIADAVVWTAAVGDASASTRRRNRYLGVLGILVTAGLVSLPIYAGLVQAGGQRALHSLFIWPFTSTSAADLPWPSFAATPPRRDHTSLTLLAAATHGAAFYYGIVSVVLLAWRLPLRRVSRADGALGLWLLLLVPPLFLYAHGRTDYLHVTPLLMICMLLAALAVDSGLGVGVGECPGYWRAGRKPTAAGREDRAGVGVGSRGDSSGEHRRRLILRPGRLRRGSKPPHSRVVTMGSPLMWWHSLGAFLWTASLLMLLPTIVFSWRTVWLSPGKRVLDLPGARGAGVHAPYRYCRQYAELVPIIQAHVAPAQSLYSGSYRHDVYEINDILIYFLSERDAPTYYWCLDAGVTSSEPVQQEMVSELSRNGVTAAVLWTASAQFEANGGGTSSGVHLLDDWLRREFAPRRLPGLFYELRLRRGLFREE
jgi:hypothetical protein